MILRARILVPVAAPPIDDGCVLIAGDRLGFVGSWRDCSRPSGEPIIDLGEVMLLAGLVNAHCHLDYTDMAGQIAPTRSFADWIKAITALKGAWLIADYARSWQQGAQMLLQTGTTTVADMEAVPDLLPEAADRTPLRIYSFLELIGIRKEYPPEHIMQSALEQIHRLESSRRALGLSPHAPYSTTPELLQLSARVARQEQRRLASHLAESEQEFDMFMHRRGPLFDWLKNQRDMTDCGYGSPVQHLERNGVLGEHLLAAHVNYLGREDAPLLGRSGVSVVHCPRSHAYFEHRPFPYGALSQAGVSLCLGTDSLATTKRQRGHPLELDLFAEMRAFGIVHPGVSPERIVRMATINGARALGLEGKAGELSPDAWADLIAVPFHGKVADAYPAIVQNEAKVTASMIGGQWVIEPEQSKISNLKSQT